MIKYSRYTTCPSNHKERAWSLIDSQSEIHKMVQRYLATMLSDQSHWAL